QTNYSAYNMLFMTAWMAHRYIDDESVRTTLKAPVETSLYNPLLGSERPIQWKQSFFDFIEAASAGNAWRGAPALGGYDKTAVARGREPLSASPAAPYYASGIQNCDANEVAAGSCVLLDGTTTVSLTEVKGEVIANLPIPMKLRPPSDFFWRSN